MKFMPPWRKRVTRFERCRERHRSGSRCEEARQCDADLDRGEELVRLTSEPGEDPAGGRAFLEALELALAQRHQRELRAGERRVDQHENHHEQQLWPDVTHVAVIQACPDPVFPDPTRKDGVGRVRRASACGWPTAVGEAR